MEECFDFRGITGSGLSYITKEGVQMKAFKMMLDRVLQPREAGIDYLKDDINAMDGFTYFFWNSWRWWNALPTNVANILALVFLYILPYLVYETTGIDVRIYKF